MSTPISNPRFKAWDSNGVPLAGGLLSTSAAGGDIPMALYQDIAFATPHANPIVLDANGEALIYSKVPFKGLLKDSDGATIDGWPIDNLEFPPYHSYVLIGPTVPATPPTNTVALYAIGTAIYMKDSAGTVTTFISSAGIQVQSYTSSDGGGSANAITGVFYPTITALTDKLRLTVISTAANSGATTFAPDAMIAKPVVCLDGTPLVAGLIAAANIPLNLEYSVALASWVLLNPMPELPAKTIQVVYTETGATATTATQMPDDDSIPQVGEGGEFMTRTITPTSATNLLKIEVVAHIGAGNNTAHIVGALFQKTPEVVNALAAAMNYPPNLAEVIPIQFTHWMVAGSTSEIVFSFRSGFGGAGINVYFNGTSAGRKLGGVMASSITVTEIRV